MMKIIQVKTNKRAKLLTGILAVSLFSAPCLADKKVDKSQLQEKVKAERVEQAIEREQHLQDAVNEFDESLKAEKAKAKNLKSRKMLKNRNCEMAKTRLEKLLTTNRARLKTPDGNTRYLSADEKLDEIKNAEKAVKKYCVNK